MNFFPGYLLAIESSCDETAASVAQGGVVLSNVIASQAEMHAKWGGVVPEAAARAHVESILPVISEALSVAGIDLRQVEAIAVTNRPGLVGALCVGAAAAKTLSFSLGLPLVGVHHLAGHLCSVYEGNPDVPFPYLALLVSGGHTELIWVEAPLKFRLVGETLDDAAGEAFDKVARLLGLPYPGGKALAELALQGNSKRYPLPRSINKDGYAFSFSGLKTAVRRLVEAEGENLDAASCAASTQAAIVDALAIQTVRAAEDLEAKAIALVGGVAANSSLRSRIQSECFGLGIPALLPQFSFCTDNAAMIALAGSLMLGEGVDCDTLWMDVFPQSSL